MISSLHAGNLPALKVSTETRPAVGNRTLTEVACAAIYGAPFKPGRGDGSIDAACAPLRLECRALWRDHDGPRWLRPHLKLMATGQTWPFNPDTQDDNEQITLRAFAGARHWLSHGRKLGKADVNLPPQAAEKAARLASMTDAEAIAYALVEADRLDRDESEANANAAAFYRMLSEAVADQRVTLKAIATEPRTSAWLPRKPGEPPHQTITPDYFELPMVHNLWDNVLEVNRFATEDEILKNVFNRTERAKDDSLVKWSDVKMPSEHVRWLVSEFINGNVTGDLSSSSSAGSKRGTTWSPNWLSLPEAIMWVVTRDQSPTRATGEQAESDRGIELGVLALLDQEKARTGESRRLALEVAEAWPALRRKIADERILAEGRSLERRRISAAVETRYPNERIPSGDAANLIILGQVPGIEPRDALAPDEMYRFTNEQGRYWYDVRLRAADVFREFPRECETHHQPDPARSGEAASASLTTMRPAFKKIEAAIQAEEEATGKPLPPLRALERNKRLTDRMIAQGLKKQEIPSERTFREYFNQGPGKPAKSG